jgi:hypothetical protein
MASTRRRTSSGRISMPASPISTAASIRHYAES